MHKEYHIEAVLAAIGQVPKPPPKGKELKLKPFLEKLASLDVLTREFLYMLAAYCYDSQRKLLYLSKLTSRFASYMPVELAEELRNDNEVVNDAPTWEDRAKALEDIMLRLWDEIEIHDREAEAAQSAR